MPDPRTDQELIDAAANGDKDAFDALYERHRDWVYSLACRFVDRAAAADVLQETFIYLLRKLPTLTLTARMTTFLYPVVRNTALALKRKQRRFVGPDDALLEFSPAGLEDARGVGGSSGAGQWGGGGASAPIVGRESLEALLQAVRRLPAAQQEVLLMRIVDGMSVQEVATALAIPEGTVKSRLHLALSTLRKDPGVPNLD